MSEHALSSILLNKFSDESLLKLPNNLNKSLRLYFNSKETKEIEKAYTVAFYAHANQKRRDGSKYITHPVEVANILADLKMDKDSICAALMHDVLEDCDITKNNLRSLFGEDVADIVDGVSKLGKLDIANRKDNDANNLQKMMLAMSKDVRVVLVKICDRLHNMRTIEHLPRSKQIRKSKETIELYGPLALRIGMQTISSELEDLAFRCIHPLRASMLESAIKKSSGGRKRIITKIRRELKRHLKSNGIENVGVKGREKNIYSIYKKIKSKHKPFSEILDVYGFRILVNSVDECYRSLGIIHNYYAPIENRFKDYIAIPKSNGYQALHTSLLALKAFPIEVQVQTRNMAEIASYGIAAHWQYKTKDRETNQELRATKWLSSLVDLNKKSNNSHEFAKSIKTDLASDEVYLFSPKGDVYALRRGSTPIDFAYEVHTDLGDTIVGCKVNRHEVPLNIELETGQTVEIISSKHDYELDPSWLNYVVTSKARSAIRANLRKQKNSDARKAGKVMLERELKRAGSSLSEYRGSSLKKVLDSIGVTSLNKLLTELGLGKRTGSIIAERFYSGLQIREGIQEPKPVLISDNKIESVTVRYAKCCHPIYGDNVIAHSDTERGMVLHHKRCQQVKPFLKKDSRYMPAIWGENKMDNLYKAKININVEDKMGILSDLTAVFSKAGINIGDLNTKKIDGKFHYFDIEIEVNSVNELKKIMQKVRAFKYTKSCTRNINEK
ncbi:MAG: guanosine 3,5-bis-pyrophosphate (ppGpp) synthetase [Gammaproteobacteria bacterium]|nr:guanosine 3,5-bis-pyrophosphate (ppGpp) synthetase [Gammaproteobacteria bacterium]